MSKIRAYQNLGHIITVIANEAKQSRAGLEIVEIASSLHSPQ
jgi:hypothetical protein